MHVATGEWVVVYSPRTTRRALAQLVADRDPSSPVRISPILMHYLQADKRLCSNRPDTESVVISRYDTKSDTSMASDMFGRVPVPIASQVTLTRIASPNDPATTEAIRAFFSVPHVLAPEMIVPVPVDPHDPLQHDDLHLSTMASLPSFRPSFASAITLPDALHVIFYRVELDHDGSERDLDFFVVHPEATRLVTNDANPLNSVVPHQASTYMSRMWPSSAPNHVNGTTTAMLMSIVKPLIHPLASSLALSPSLALIGRRRSGKRGSVADVARKLGMQLMEINCFDVVQPTERQTSERLATILQSALTVHPVILHLRRLAALVEHSNAQGRPDIGLLANALYRDLDALYAASRAKGAHVVVVGSNDGNLPGALASCFAHEVHVDALDKSDREAIVIDNLACVPDLACAAAALTAGATWGDLRDLCGAIECSARMRHDRCQKQNDDDDDSAAEYMALYGCEPSAPVKFAPDTVAISDDELSQALKGMQSRAVTASIPNVRWEDIGGLENVKQAILDTIELPLKHPSLFTAGIRQRSGVLLYGPPGTGKTLVAKAVATECSLSFISVKGPELLNMYVGESEANVRAVFERARDSRPCVLFFDELDALAPNRGQGSDSGGVMDRVVSQLLTEIDGIGKVADVFIIGATNRPDLIDSALLRPGRLDTCIYLGVSEDKAAQLTVVKALTRKFTLHEDVDLEAIVEDLPMTLTGADFYALCSDALLNALKTKISRVEAELSRTDDDDDDRDAVSGRRAIREYLRSCPPEDLRAVVTQDDFRRAASTIAPSLSNEELARYQQLRKQFVEARK
ncbi:hypothetical protein PBRA_003831 [Plasmodiophora brassicae]|nr:hypothetical protein PBRA_003831 [Plasmodiophora brassicae]